MVDESGQALGDHQMIFDDEDFDRKLTRRISGPLTLGNAGRCESCPFSRRGKQSDDAHTEYDPRLRANTRAGRSLAAVRFLRAEANDQMQLHDAGGRDTDLTRLELAVQGGCGADGIIPGVQVPGKRTVGGDPHPYVRLVGL